MSNVEIEAIAEIEVEGLYPAGPQGPANKLSIGNVDVGITASATISGKSPNQILNLILPKPIKGIDYYTEEEIGEAVNEIVQDSTNEFNLAIAENMNKVETEANNAELSSDKAQQALSDLLRMLGKDIATLENGKIPASQIPAIATTEIYYASNLEEMNNLVAQNGDICIRTDEKKSYIYKDTGWVFLVSPSDFATNAEHANTADFASNAGMINDKRIISMTQSQYDLAVKEENTYYFVTAD